MEKIAVIGAGMAGVTAARRLAAAGRHVTLYDKSRGFGGRMATRRGTGFALDHGAPGVQASDPAFRAELEAAGAVRDPDLGYVGQPGMSSLVKSMAEGIEAVMGVEIAAMQPVTAGLALVDVSGTTYPEVDGVVVAIPAPQARRFSREVHEIDAALAEVEMAAIWSLLLAFSEDAALPAAADPFDKILHDGAKAGRSSPPDTWVAHAGQDWTRRHLEEPRDDMVQPLMAGLGPMPMPLYAAAHRWRYGLTAKPLGTPCLVAPKGRVVFGGDWALGNSAQDAWRSGNAMAEALGA